MVRKPKGTGRERDEFLDAIGHRIKTARTKADLTQKDLAAIVGTTPAWIYLAEDGQQNFQISSLRRIAEALEMSVRDLLPEGPEAGSEYEASREVSEGFGTAITQLTGVLGLLHRLNALSDRRKGTGRLRRISDKSGEESRPKKTSE